MFSLTSGDVESYLALIACALFLAAEFVRTRGWSRSQRSRWITLGGLLAASLVVIFFTEDPLELTLLLAVFLVFAASRFVAQKRKARG